MADDAAISVKQRVVGRPFQKGKSGNPTGKPKAIRDVLALAREHTLEAIATLQRALRSDDERVSCIAAQALLDRGWGRPMQAVEHSGPNGSPLTVEVRKYGAEGLEPRAEDPASVEAH